MRKTLKPSLSSAPPRRTSFKPGRNPVGLGLGL
jgi:hypothetical protein